MPFWKPPRNMQVTCRDIFYVGRQTISLKVMYDFIVLVNLKGAYCQSVTRELGWPSRGRAYWVGIIFPVESRIVCTRTPALRFLGFCVSGSGHL